MYGLPPVLNATIHRVVPVPPHRRMSTDQAAAVLDELASNFRWGFYSRVLDKQTLLGFMKKATIDEGMYHTAFLSVEELVPLFERKTPEDAEGRQATFKAAGIVSIFSLSSLSGSRLSFSLRLSFSASLLIDCLCSWFMSSW